MVAIAYNSHEFIKPLKPVGFEEQQAEVLYTAICNLQDAKLEDVATKRDLRELEFRMDVKFKELDTKLESRLREMELRMVIKLGGMVILGMGLMFGLMRVWPMPVQYVPVAGQEFRLPPAVQR
ncbi:MAG: hypothetical protein HQL55_06765 [Magnetococcales bacterium]|nr:hypothetical protein [Magnetococcales bacterium]